MSSQFQAWGLARPSVGRVLFALCHGHSCMHVRDATNKKQKKQQYTPFTTCIILEHGPNKHKTQNTICLPQNTTAYYNTFMCETLGHMSGMSNGVSGSDRKSCPPTSYWLGIPASSRRTRLLESSESLLASTAPAGPPPTTMKSYSTPTPPADFDFLPNFSQARDGHGCGREGGACFNCQKYCSPVTIGIDHWAVCVSCAYRWHFLREKSVKYGSDNHQLLSATKSIHSNQPRRPKYLSRHVTDIVVVYRERHAGGTAIPAKRKPMISRKHTSSILLEIVTREKKRPRAGFSNPQLTSAAVTGRDAVRTTANTASAVKQVASKPPTSKPTCKERPQQEHSVFYSRSTPAETIRMLRSRRECIGVGA